MVKHIQHLVSTAIFMSLIFGINSQDLCDPVSACSVSNPGDYVIDPENYNNFYVCIEESTDVVPSDSSFSCGTDMCFDPSTSVCIDQDGPVCYNDCVNTCDSSCGVSTNFIASTESCSKYVACASGNPIVLDCPDDMPYWDGAVCQEDPEQCCDICSPRCAEAGTEVYDPYDCTMFYICEGSGQPNWDLHGSCPDGEFFDPIYERCEIGETCTAPCE